MRKKLIFSVVSLLFVAQTNAVTPASTFLVRNVEQNNVTTTYNVRIKLVHTDGSPVTGSVGLR